MKRNDQNNSIILWTARIMSILFAFFISVFAIDVFSEGHGFWKTILGLIMHLIPTFIIILFIIISWQNELIGGILFTILGIVYIVFTWGKSDWRTYALIPLPLIVLGILFFIAWYQKKHQLVR